MSNCFRRWKNILTIFPPTSKSLLLKLVIYTRTKFKKSWWFGENKICILITIICKYELFSLFRHSNKNISSSSFFYFSHAISLILALCYFPPPPVFVLHLFLKIKPVNFFHSDFFVPWFHQFIPGGNALQIEFGYSAFDWKSCVNWSYSLYFMILSTPWRLEQSCMPFSYTVNACLMNKQPFIKAS